MHVLATKSLTRKYLVEFFVFKNPVKSRRHQGRMFWKIWTPIYTQKKNFMKNQAKTIVSLDKKSPNPHKGAELAQIWHEVWMPVKTL